VKERGRWNVDRDDCRARVHSNEREKELRTMRQFDVGSLVLGDSSEAPCVCAGLRCQSAFSSVSYEDDC
jgi:hypothetical protein